MLLETTTKREYVAIKKRGNQTKVWKRGENVKVSISVTLFAFDFSHFFVVLIPVLLKWNFMEWKYLLLYASFSSYRFGTRLNCFGTPKSYQ